MKVSLEAIKAAAPHRKPGYLEACLQTGTQTAPDTLEFTPEQYRLIRATYNPNRQPETVAPEWPTLTQLATNFATAVSAWAAAGFPTVTRAQFDLRLEACQACENWNRTSFIPRCRICGCAGLKLWLATERCPAGRWQ